MPDKSKDSEFPNRPLTKTNPDPSERTREDLFHSIAQERAITDGQLEVLRERLTGIDKATELRLSGIVEIPHQIDEKVKNLEALMEEKFDSIAKQFAERDTRSERESRDNKLAVDAAFAAQEKQTAAQNKSNAEAINKSEIATTETINKLAELFKSTTDALRDKDDEKGRRLERIESVKQGGREAYSALYVMAGLIVSVIVALVAVGVFKK